MHLCSQLLNLVQRMPDLGILVHIIQTLLIHALHQLCDVADQDLMVRILILHSL